MKKKLLNPLFLMLAVLLSGCTDLVVSNQSNFPVKIVASPPGWEGNATKEISGGGQETFTSSVGGPYTVYVIPGERYGEYFSRDKAELESLITSPDATPEQIKDASERLVSLKKRMDAYFKNQMAASCGGMLQDYGTATAVITYDEGSQTFMISCAEANPEVQTGGGDSN